MRNNIKFKLLLQQYKNKIYSYCLYILKNKMDAEDTTQEVMVRLWENMDEINMLNSKSWLYKAAYNRCIDLLRKRNLLKKRETLFDEDMEEYISAPDEQAPDKTAEGNERKEVLVLAINNLSAEQKNVLIMYELQGLKYREISEVMNLPINTVKVYIMRARKNLHSELKKNRIFSDD